MTNSIDIPSNQIHIHTHFYNSLNHYIRYKFYHMKAPMATVISDEDEQYIVTELPNPSPFVKSTPYCGTGIKFKFSTTLSDENDFISDQEFEDEIYS